MLPDPPVSTSPQPPVAVALQVVELWPSRRLLLLGRQANLSSISMTGGLPGVRGIAHGVTFPKPPFNPPGRSLLLDRAERLEL